MSFIPRQEPFICEHCEAEVTPLSRGTYRDHCPKCLWSKHVDAEGPGDRASECQGLLQPIAIDQDGKKGWVIVYACERCGKEGSNRAAPDDEIAEFMEKNTNH